MNKVSRTGARVAALVVAATVLTTGLAFADDMAPDGDGPTAANVSTLDFGSVCVGQTYNRTLTVYIMRSWPTLTDQSRTFNGGSTVTMTLTAPITDHADLSAAIPATPTGSNTVVLPNDWRTNTTTWFSGAIYTGDSATVNVTLTPSAPGSPASSRTINLTASGIGGNSGTTSFSRVIADGKVTWSAANCDSTAPVITPTITGTLGNNGWYTSNVTVSWSVVDSQSTVSSTTGCGSTTISTDTTGTTLTCSATSAGGTSSQSVTIKRDATAPSASIAVSAGTLGNNGWYVDDVTVDTTGTDATSGVASCTADQFQTTDTTSTNFNGSCTDNAGNVGNAGPLAVKRDATAPTLNPSVSPNPVLLNGSATASANATDATSGIASHSCGTVVTSSVGSHTVACTATDNAGNTTNANASYSVNYVFSGFFSPVDNNGVLNKAKAGQAIPFKWRLTDANGDPVLNLSSVTLTATNLNCSLAGSVDLLEEVATGSSGLQNLGDGYYQFNWATPKSYGNSCKTAKLNLGEGTTHDALFQFTK